MILQSCRCYSAPGTNQPCRVAFSLHLHASQFCTQWGRLLQSSSSELHNLLQDRLVGLLYLSSARSHQCRAGGKKAHDVSAAGAHHGPQQMCGL